jgi:hypothetical protein
MANIDENTVEGFNQLKESDLISYIGNKNAPLKILIIGNSITRHGPKPEIGWDRDWGMAASCEENDYVHLLCSDLKKEGIDSFVMVRQGWWWERNYMNDTIWDEFKKEHEFDADIVVFRLGENILKDDRPYCYEKLKAFAPYICPHGKIVFTTLFWKCPTVDGAIKQVAEERGDIWVNGCFDDDEECMAIGQFEHRGVAMHPSDKGMRAIATSVLGGIKTILNK